MVGLYPPTRLLRHVPAAERRQVWAAASKEAGSWPVWLVQIPLLIVAMHVTHAMVVRHNVPRGDLAEWLLTGLVAGPLIAFAVATVSYWRARRCLGVALVHQGRCHACGYDRRATPGRCPECGAAAAF